MARHTHLDGLARDGVLRPRLCPGPLTLPAHASILSGLYPVATASQQRYELGTKIRTLAESEGPGFRHRRLRVLFLGRFPVRHRPGPMSTTTPSRPSSRSGANADGGPKTFARFSRWLAGIGSGGSSSGSTTILIFL
jgi:hypothetical protein